MSIAYWRFRRACRQICTDIIRKVGIVWLLLLQDTNQVINSQSPRAAKHSKRPRPTPGIILNFEHLLRWFRGKNPLPTPCYFDQPIIFSPQTLFIDFQYHRARTTSRIFGILPESSLVRMVHLRRARCSNGSSDNLWGWPRNFFTRNTPEEQVSLFLAILPLIHR